MDEYKKKKIEANQDNILLIPMYSSTKKIQDSTKTNYRKNRAFHPIRKTRINMEERSRLHERGCYSC
ncbi:hypothetical protein BWD12_00910 [Leptospira santarosai serovar Bananal]|uniref:Uncharacterized protein n=1 Tax=Leptospira santarosai TaxID=28183 RepID=A0AB73LNF9_9LEPT|nr:hypothetical protein BWD11_16405 [Leptospira santarosai serovar Grippotyphosa]ONF81503.1 hypothetical protein BWD12_00910 [Leptospira santarosai serovar Bananal]ONF93688.1 hypothetical protein BWD14_06400 [Leptospira santarosai]